MQNAQPDTPPARFRFGARVLDPARRELQVDGVAQPLAARVFACLHYLVLHRDRAVGRDELVRAVFGRPDVSDAQLAQVVLRARRALGDDGQEQRVIRTVPRFGFRWAAEVVMEAALEPVPDIAPQAEPALPVALVPAANDDHATVVEIPDVAIAIVRAPARASRMRRFRPLSITLLVLLALGLATFVLQRTHPRSETRVVQAPIAAHDAIVVLPMRVDGDGAAWARLGMMDFVVDRLRHGNLPVWSSDATLALLRSRGAPTPDPQHVRRDTGAAWIVEGQAHALQHQWQVAMTATDAAGRTLRGVARDADLVAATQQAADRMLAGIGGASPRVASASPGLDERLQRAQSALLANDPATARRLLTDAPAAQRASPRLQFRLAQVELADGRYAAGLDTTQRLLAPGTTLDEPLRSQLFALQGTLLMRLDRYPDAERSYEQAIRRLGTTKDASEMGRALIGRGAARMAQGRFDAALADLGSARVQLVRAGDRLSVAKVDGNLGVLEMQRDHPQQAIASFEKAERDFEAMGSVLELAGIRNMCVAMHLQLLQPEEARAVSDRTWAMRDRLHDPAVVADLVLARADVMLATGHLREARALLDLPISRQASPSDFHRHEYLEMELARQRGDAASTARLGQAALRDWPAGRNAGLRAWAALRTREAALAAALPEPADDGALAADPLAVHLGAAMRLRRAGDPHAADARYRDAVALAEAGGVPSTIANAVIARAQWLLATNRLDDAAALIGRVAPWAEQDFDLALLQVALYRRLGQAPQWRTALVQARRLAGERPIPTTLAAAWTPSASFDAGASR